MDLLAGYGEDAGDDSATNSPKDLKIKNTHVLGAKLENEWLSFEKMIAPGGIQGEGTVDRSTYLVDGVVAYPGMSIRKPSMSDLVPEVQSSETDSEEEQANEEKNKVAKNDKEGEEDDAFFMLRKQIKEQDRSSSSDGSSDSSSDSSRSPSPKRGSLSPPRLSPVNSVKSHGSEPPELVHSDSAFKTEKQTEEIVKEQQQVEEKHDKEKSIDKDRKRSHRDRSRSKSKKHRSRSKSRDRKHRHSSRDRRRHKDKKSHHKSRDSKRNRDRKRSRSKDRKRSKSRDRKSRSKDKHESKSKSRAERRDSSRDKKRDKRSKSRSHSKDRKHAKSRDGKERRDRSRDRKKTHSSRNRHRSKERKSRSRSKHRSRSRDRSRERLRSRSPVLGKKLTFKEQMRQNILTASKQMSQEKDPEVPAKRLNESLKPSDLLRGIRINSGESVTPQQALIQTMAAMHQKAQEITGIEVPKYYNPAAVNPLKYAEQVQKRKLLWSKKTDDKQKEKEEQIETQWKSAFIADDNATTSKFRKLMGMKEGDATPESLEKMSDEQRQKQQELFQRLDKEYQFARMTTHTQRGVGLGFSSTIYDPNHPANPP